MTHPDSAIYEGIVVHRRFRPVRHAFRYRVFTLLLDCDELESTGRHLRTFSYNRRNLLTLHDRDHGDGTPIRAYLARIASEGGYPEVRRFLILCYPRVLGYVFNPLTVYFGLDEAGAVRLIVYEVNNTFGQRKTYVIPAEPDAAGVVEQDCPKEFYVSPFNPVDGQYRFHATPIGDRFSVTISYARGGQPVMNGCFSGQRAALTDRNLLGALVRTGWLTAKVIAGIHFEAFRLWLKGLRMVKRPPAPREPVSYAASPSDAPR